MIPTAYVLAALLAAGIIFVGLRFFLVPETSARAFGVPFPNDAYLSVKGIRDIASGLVTLALLVLGDQQALGWVLLALTVIPIGDTLIVLRRGGSRALAYGVHGGTAAVMVLVAAALILL